MKLIPDTSTHNSSTTSVIGMTKSILWLFSGDPSMPDKQWVDVPSIIQGALQALGRNIKFNKQVYNKNDYQKIIDTSFTQLGVQTIQQQLNVQPNVNDFFAMYNDIFYNINELGATNSHEYLVKTSGEYIGSDTTSEEITALQDEITQLRTELLDTQKQLIELQTGTTL